MSGCTGCGRGDAILMTHLLIQQHRDMQISQTMQGARKRRVFHGTTMSLPILIMHAFVSGILALTCVYCSLMICPVSSESDL